MFLEMSRIVIKDSQPSKKVILAKANDELLAEQADQNLGAESPTV